MLLRPERQSRKTSNGSNHTPRQKHRAQDVVHVHCLALAVASLCAWMNSYLIKHIALGNERIPQGTTQAHGRGGKGLWTRTSRKRRGWLGCPTLTPWTSWTASWITSRTLNTLGLVVVCQAGTRPPVLEDSQTSLHHTTLVAGRRLAQSLRSPHTVHHTAPLKERAIVLAAVEPHLRGGHPALQVGWHPSQWAPVLQFWTMRWLRMRLVGLALIPRKAPSFDMLMFHGLTMLKLLQTHCLCSTL